MIFGAPSEPEEQTVIVQAGGTGGVTTPQFRVFADGVLIAERSIPNPVSGPFDVHDDSRFETFVFRFEGPAPEEIELVYFGDGKDAATGIDRNLYVDWIEVNGERHEAEIDGDFTPRNPKFDFLSGPREKLFVNGTLTFDDLA
ncbi:MAG TPA: carbohydrate-binding domain-containing protein [Paracoccaceae bacterium]|nr:carbohydrate-binding domain-containing protein [Paracoccaceae bacterium]